MSSSFIVNVACDFGKGKINTGIEFPVPPSSLGELLEVVEELYSAELRLHVGDQEARFHVVVCLLLADIIGEGDSRKGRWVEVSTIEQIGSGAQLFVFDANSPPPSKGTIPKVQFIVAAAQIMRHSLSTSSGAHPARPMASVSSASRSSVSAPRTQQQQQQGPASLVDYRTETVGPAGQHIAPISSSSSGPVVLEDSSGHVKSALQPEAREFLFTQLCRASGGGNVISAQRLHSVFVENGLLFPTDVFSEMMEGRFQLTREDWRTVEVTFPPVVDALYDRLVAKSASRAGGGALVDMKQRLQVLQDEEHQLLIRHARLREEMARLARELRDEEERVQKLEGLDRSKEWNMVNKYVTLRLRQSKLRQEEAQINHQLSLL
jgi:hypothetical protein